MSRTLCAQWEWTKSMVVQGWPLKICGVLPRLWLSGSSDHIVAGKRDTRRYQKARKTIKLPSVI
jgi:hypothetical protein